MHQPWTLVTLQVLSLAVWSKEAAAFAPPILAARTAVRQTSSSSRSRSRSHSSRLAFYRRAVTSLHAESDDNQDAAAVPGMADAFRQLDALESLGSDDDAAEPAEKTQLPPPIDSTAASISSPEDVPATEAATPEKEVQMYKEMVKELEQQNEDDLYSNVLSEMGGTQPAPPPAAVNPEAQSSSAEPTTTAALNSDTEEFMNQALAEAMAEVKVNNPSIADSILDDKEIMKEIEEIFERGNEKLMESLEEIRQEQTDLAAASAKKNADSVVDGMNNDAARLRQAEGAIETMLTRVKKETADVEQAVEDLKIAQKEIDKDFILRLKRGGIPKQGALVGFLLFSTRSIIDSIASISDESHISAALIQGGVAVACAAFFFLV